VSAVVLLATLAAASVACLRSARAGMFATLVVGFLADPLRKTMSGEPLWVSGVVGAVAVLALVGVVLRREESPLARLHEWAPYLRLPLALALLWVVIQSGRAFERTGSATIALIGILAYTLPVVALLLGHAATRRARDLRRLLLFYVACVLVMASGTLLSRAGVGGALVGQVGTGLAVYDRREAVLLQPGFFRAPELAAWHTSMAIGLVLLLFVTWRRRLSLLLGVGSAALLGYALFLTGRRKFLVQLALFLVLWTSLALLSKWARARLVVVVVCVLVVASVPLSAWLWSADRAAEDPLLARMALLGGQAEGRVAGMVLTGVEEVYARNGFLGVGAGAGSQGSQYYGGGADLAGGSAEGGFAKVLAELGVPGLLLFLWLGIAFLRYVVAVVRSEEASDVPWADRAAALGALVLGNAPTFSVAHQAFGDPMVLCSLGFVAGGLLRLPSAIAEESAAEARSEEDAPPSEDRR
jgi:hypothetical protein